MVTIMVTTVHPEHEHEWLRAGIWTKSKMATAMLRLIFREV